MLFCHAGFNVNTILLDGAEEEISANLLKELTGHSPWSKANKPNWVKADIKYPVAVIFDGKIPLNSPLTKGIEDNTQIIYSDFTFNKPSLRAEGVAIQNHQLDISCNKYADYIKEQCEFIKILVDKESAINQQFNDLKKQIIAIPDNPLNLRSIFEKILSETIRFTASKALDGGITYSLKGDFSKIDYLNDLEKALAEEAVEKSWIDTSLACNDTCDDIATSSNCGCNAAPPVICFAKDSSLVNGGVSSENRRIEIVFEADEAEIKPTRNRIYVSKHKNGLLLTDSIETRLLPDFSCQSCYARFVTYLKTELSKN